MTRSCVVTGITGQDGSILAELLLEKGYRVYGLIRRSSRGMDLGCSSHLENEPGLEVVEGDITDLPSLRRLAELARPDQWYHMAAQSHVRTSFDQPVYTASATGLGALNCLEAIRSSGIHTRFLNASTSELFGGLSSEPMNEETPFHPRSPYGCAKLFAHWITVNYRESYKMFACNSICFNHEEPGKRGPNFVTRKITRAVARIKLGKQKRLALGNLDARRDWSRARDVCKGMILMLNSSEPREYVLSSGEAHSVREFCDLAFKHVGLDYRDHVDIDPILYRPAEVDVLVGDSTRAREELGWKPETSFEDLVKAMVEWDLADQNTEELTYI